MPFIVFGISAVCGGKKRIVRYWIAALVTGLALLVTGCSVIEQATGSVEAGDCVKQSGDDFTEVDCSSAEAKFVVLKKTTGSERCRDVAGTTYTYYDTDEICLGDKGADVSQAINTAQVGDCFTDSADAARKLPCADPAAVYKVLDRQEGGMTTFACKSVAGAEVTYTWELKSVGETKFPKLGPDLIFCLANKNVDPTKVLEKAKAGDCLRATTVAPNLEIADCGAADAKYRVLRVVTTQSLCDNVSGATRSFSYTSGGLVPLPQVFCVADLR